MRRSHDESLGEFQAEGTVSAKALGQPWAQHIPGTEPESVSEAAENQMC